MSAPLLRPAKDPAQRAWLRALELTARATRDHARTLPCAVAEWAERYGDRPALIGDEESYSFGQLAARIGAEDAHRLGRVVQPCPGDRRRLLGDRHSIEDLVVPPQRLPFGALVNSDRADHEIACSHGAIGALACNHQAPPRRRTCAILSAARCPSADSIAF